MKIYVASSWRNPLQPAVVKLLEGVGHEVYDFRHPEPGNDGFSWREIDPNWSKWKPQDLRDGLEHAVSKKGFGLDMKALMECDACLLVLPCGRSAHLELGYAVGAGKQTAIMLHEDKFEPELMYLMVDHLLIGFDEVLDLAEGWKKGTATRKTA